MALEAVINREDAYNRLNPGNAILPPNGLTCTGKLRQGVLTGVLVDIPPVLSLFSRSGSRWVTRPNKTKNAETSKALAPENSEQQGYGSRKGDPVGSPNQQQCRSRLSTFLQNRGVLSERRQERKVTRPRTISTAPRNQSRAALGCRSLFVR
jgi:hypothetical protein